jgi:hypothetical protein
MPDFLRNYQDDAAPFAVLVMADVRVVLLVPIVCPHVHLTTVTSLCPLQIREREKFIWMPHHSPFTGEPHGPVCLGRLFTDIQ